MIIPIVPFPMEGGMGLSKFITHWFLALSFCTLMIIFLTLASQGTVFIPTQDLGQPQNKHYIRSCVLGMHYWFQNLSLNIDEFKSRFHWLCIKFDPDYQPRNVLNNDFSFSTAATSPASNTLQDEQQNVLQ